MKKSLLIIFFLVYGIMAKGQSPTLAVGLESLTMNKGSIDVTVLTEIIIEKQQELKRDALKRFMLKMFPEQNYATKYYIQHCLHILLNEKNAKVIEKEVFELTTNYTLSLAIAHVLYEHPALKHVINASNNVRLLNTTNTALQQDNSNKIPFDTWVDLVSATLSGIEVLKQKGFYVHRIDFRDGPNYWSDKIDSTRLKIAMLGIQNIIEPYFKYYPIISQYYTSIAKSKSGEDVRSIVIENFSQASQVDLKDLENVEFYKNNNIKSESASLKIIFTQISEVSSLIAKAKQTYIDLDQILVLEKKYLAMVQDTMTLLKEIKTIVNQYQLTPLTLAPDSMTLNDTLRDATLNNLENLKRQLKIKETEILQLNTKFNELEKNLEALKITIKPKTWNSFKQNETKIRLSLDSVKTQKENELKSLRASLSKSRDFFRDYLSRMSDMLINSKAVDMSKLNADNKYHYSDYASLISQTYLAINELIAKDTITLESITYFEKEVVPEFLRLGSLLFKNKEELKNEIKSFQLLTGMMKLHTVSLIPESFIYDHTLLDVLKFISEIGDLDKAETYQDMLKLFEQVNTRLSNTMKEGEFKKTYILFSRAIEKYSLVNTAEQYVEIDIVSFLNELQDYYLRNNHSYLSLYLTLGLNQNFFLNEVMLPGEVDKISNVGFASEKLGLKFRLSKVYSKKGLENTIKEDVNLDKRNPFINEWYGILYGSGFLYNLANTSTQKNFNYPHLGIGSGLRFYNALDINLIFGFPFIKNQPILKNTFAGIGLDIPLGEYLEKVGRKKLR